MKKSQLKQIIKEEISKSIKEGGDEDWYGTKPDERNPSNKMIYDLLKEIHKLIKDGQDPYSPNI